MQRLKTSWILIAVGLVILVLLGWLYSIRAAPETVLPISNSGTYTNSTYGYSFEYPKTYSNVEYSPQVVAVGVPDGDELAEVGVSPSGTSTYKDFTSFVHAKSELYCTADGPTGSLRCPSILTSAPFTSDKGIKGEKFYLKLVLTTKGQAATSTSFGPIYAFNISANNASSTMTALIVRPSLSSFSNEGAALSDSIAKTIQINKIVK